MTDLLRHYDPHPSPGRSASYDVLSGRSARSHPMPETKALFRWDDDGGAILAAPPRSRTLPPARPEPMALWRWEDDGGASL